MPSLQASVADDLSSSIKYTGNLMNPLLTGLVTLLIVFGAASLGLRLRSVYPKKHLGLETQDTVKLAIGLISMMSALLLGLLVSSAKMKYDAQKNEVIALSAKIVVLDRALAAYGQESEIARVQLRRTVEQMIERTWPDSNVARSQLDPTASSGIDVFEAIVTLTPKSDAQGLIKSSLLPMTVELGQMRWLLYAQSNDTISLPMVVLLVFWLAVIFFSYGLFATHNGTVVAILFAAALSVSGAMLMILELHHAFGGLIGIASTPMDMALANLGSPGN